MSDALDEALEQVQSSSDPLQLKTPPPLTQHPAAVYLSQLRPKSKKTMQRCLDLIAKILTQGHCEGASQFFE